MAHFYLDEDVTEDLAVHLRGRGHIVVTTTEAGRKGTRDHEQLWFAAVQEWIVITVNRRDFESLHGAWLLWRVSRSHMGIIILHQMAEGHLARIAAEINDLVADGEAFFARQVFAGKAIAITPVSPVTSHLYRRFRDGRWDCIG